MDDCPEDLSAVGMTHTPKLSRAVYKMCQTERPNVLFWPRSERGEVATQGGGLKDQPALFRPGLKMDGGPYDSIGATP